MPQVMARGINTNEGNAFTRTLRPEDTVAGQVRGLIAEGSPVLQQQRLLARRGQASRGFGNSGAADQAGMLATLSAAMPIAQSDAAAYNAEGTGNQEALNRRQLSDNDNNTQIQISNTAAGTTQRGQDLDLEGRRLQLALQRDQMNQDERLTLSDREFRAGESGRDRDFQGNESRLGREQDESQFGRNMGFNRDRMAQENDQYNTGIRERVIDRRFQSEEAERDFVRGNLARTQNLIFSNPDLLGNPQAAAAMSNFWNTNAISQFRSAFFGGKP